MGLSGGDRDSLVWMQTHLATAWSVLEDVMAEVEAALKPAVDDADEPIYGEGQVAVEERPDYVASSASPRPPSCYRCEEIPPGQAFLMKLGLCYRHAEDEASRALADRDRATGLAQENLRQAVVVHEQAMDLARLRGQVHDLDGTVRAQAVALRKRGGELADLRKALHAAQVALADAP